MVKKLIRIILIILGVLILSVAINYLLFSWVHEFMHAIPCWLSGNIAQISFCNIMCGGIEKENYFVQFLFFMGPYIFWLIIIGLISLTKNKKVKYFSLIPLTDTVINYAMSFQRTDFISLMVNTRWNIFCLIVSCFIIASIFVIGYKIIKINKLFSFSEFRKIWLR